MNATESTTLPSKMSALSMVLSHVKTSGFSENTVEGRILGGNDQLPKAFAKKLGSKIKYNHPVKRVITSSGEVEVHLSSQRDNHTIKGAKIVFAPGAPRGAPYIYRVRKPFSKC